MGFTTEVLRVVLSRRQGFIFRRHKVRQRREKRDVNEEVGDVKQPAVRAPAKPRE